MRKLFMSERQAALKLAEELEGAFSWDDAKPGHAYWSDVFNALNGLATEDGPLSCPHPQLNHRFGETYQCEQCFHLFNLKPTVPTPESRPASDSPTGESGALKLRQTGADNETGRCEQ